MGEELGKRGRSTADGTPHSARRLSRRFPPRSAAALRLRYVSRSFHSVVGARSGRRLRKEAIYTRVTNAHRRHPIAVDKPRHQRAFATSDTHGDLVVTTRTPSDPCRSRTAVGRIGMPDAWRTPPTPGECSSTERGLRGVVPEVGVALVAVPVADLHPADRRAGRNCWRRPRFAESQHRG